LILAASAVINRRLRESDLWRYGAKFGRALLGTAGDAKTTHFDKGMNMRLLKASFLLAAIAGALAACAAQPTPAANDAPGFSGFFMGSQGGWGF